MRGTDHFENVITQVHAVSQNHYDVTLPVIDMEFESLDRMWIAGRETEVMPSAQKLFANRLRVPYSYLSRCPEQLQRENLNHWLREEAKERDNLFCRFDGNRLRAVFTERYTELDHMEILSKMLEYGINPDAEVHYSLDSSMLLIKVPDYMRTFGIGNDKITPGCQYRQFRGRRPGVFHRGLLFQTGLHQRVDLTNSRHIKVSAHKPERSGRIPCGDASGRLRVGTKSGSLSVVNGITG